MTASGKIGASFLFVSLPVICLLLICLVHFTSSTLTRLSPKWQFNSRVYAAGMVTIFTLIYTTIMNNSLELLSCQQVGALGLRWKWDAIESCYEVWQVGPLLAVGFSVFLPIAFICVVVRSNHPQAGQLLRTAAWIIQDSFGDHCAWWLGVSLLRRFVFVFSFVFIQTPSWRGLVLCAACLSQLIANAVFRPFLRQGHRGTHIYETASLVILCLLACSNLPALALKTKAVTSPLPLSVELEWLQLLLVLIPGVVFCVWQPMHLRNAAKAPNHLVATNRVELEVVGLFGELKSQKSGANGGNGVVDMQWTSGLDDESQHGVRIVC